MFVNMHPQHITVAVTVATQLNAKPFWMYLTEL